MRIEQAGGVRFAVANQITAWRVRTFATKEPGTIAWIDAFAADDVMLDVGANIGLYALYAAPPCSRSSRLPPISRI
jgi:hypothetical protein